MSEELSTCCGSHVLGEVHNGIGFCASCRDHAEFVSSCEECGDETPLKVELCKKCEGRDDDVPSESMTDLMAMKGTI